MINLLSSIGFLLLISPASLLPLSAEPPNVVFIYIDDLGFSDVGFLGGQHFATPSIDALAQQGMVFRQAYAAAPNCAPSRACLMSGQYTPRHGIYTVNNATRGPAYLRKLVPVANKTVLQPDVTTLGELFQQAGYRTAYMGKWHLGKPGLSGPSEQGFELNMAGNHSGTPRGGHFSPYQNPQLPDPTDSSREYLTDRLTEEAVQFLRKHQQEPLFLFLSHYAVHTPIQAKQSLVKPYQARARQEGFNAKYAAMVESVDQSVGKVVQTLSELSLLENTLVIFYSDNGGHAKITRNDPLRGGKGMPYEGGIRVPLCITWPGRIQAASQCDVPVHGVDFFETFRVMLQARPPSHQPLDGVDLMPLWQGRVDHIDRSLFWHFPAYLEGKNYPGAPDPHFRARPFGIIRHGPWKLIENFEDQRFQLYDLSTDIGETNDLASQFPQRVQQLSGKLQRWRSQIEAPVPVEPNPEFRGPEQSP